MDLVGSWPDDPPAWRGDGRDAERASRNFSHHLDLAQESIAAIELAGVDTTSTDELLARSGCRMHRHAPRRRPPRIRCGGVELMPLAWIANAVPTSQGCTPGVVELSEEELQPLERAGLARRGGSPGFGEAAGAGFDPKAGR